MNLNSQTSCEELEGNNSRDLKAHDIFCFECHRQGDLFNCDSCPRVYHLKCLRLNTLPRRNWICPECEVGLEGVSMEFRDMF